MSVPLRPMFAFITALTVTLTFTQSLFVRESSESIARLAQCPEDIMIYRDVNGTVQRSIEGIAQKHAYSPVLARSCELINIIKEYISVFEKSNADAGLVSFVETLNQRGLKVYKKSYSEPPREGIMVSRDVIDCFWGGNGDTWVSRQRFK
ncbi:unnamed protein product [Cylicocyclus nassatus]|uniref:Uncharacterized protein n=1 Tax=Cylicocyclus nassatus TaxID=53992 RepID=A0AA36M5A3_CYLNA|nr:unnamed protein product [Cylicocyclus nassatus]